MWRQAVVALLALVAIACSTAKADTAGDRAYLPIVSRAANLSDPAVPTATPSATALPVGSVRVTLGQPEEIWGPDSITDNPFHLRVAGAVTSGYLANADTFGFTVDGPAFRDLHPFPTPVVLSHPTTPTAFDACGAWINSTIPVGASLVAIYHAETDCTTANGFYRARKSVGYAVSTDGGLTFVRPPSYPSSQVIAAPRSPVGFPSTMDPTQLLSEGDQHVIRVGDYYYLYFVAQRDYQVRVARSPVADGGRPGTWWKYDGNGWQEPGVGGESTPIARDILALSWVARSMTLGGYLGIAYYDDGFGLAFSEDGLHGWRKVTPSLVPTGDYEQAAPIKVPIRNYLSLIGLDGGEELGTSFWLYYMEVREGDDFSRRRLVRQTVTIGNAPTPTPAPTRARPGALSLTRYQNSSSPDTQVTSATPAAGYGSPQVLGYVYDAEPRVRYLAMYDCYLGRERDFMVDVRADCSAPTDATVQPMGRIGWVAQEAFPGSVAIYRCFNPDAAPAGDHFVSRDFGCEGHPTSTDGWRVGFVASTPEVLP